ncbi:MAG: hypothetical protein RIM72_10435 [Alphaproteobacteria bacterium]
MLVQTRGVQTTLRFIELVVSIVFGFGQTVLKTVCSYWFVCLPVGLLLSTPAHAQENSAVTEIVEFGVKWTFENPVTAGKFANGHYWVLAPVTLTAVLPSFDGSRNGWEVNPDNPKEQGFDERGFNFDPGRVPTLPYTASTAQSIVKVASVTDKEKCRPCVRTVSVLTVLESAPPDGGSSIFRPPYFGTEKLLISVDRLKMELLPSYDRVRNTPSSRDISKRYAITHLDHQSTWVGRFLHPSEAMPDYGSDIANFNASSALTLMVSVDTKEKHKALIRYVNNGIDLYYMMKGGVTWWPAGGHGEGRKLPIVFASVMLDIPEMLEHPAMSERRVFGENGGVAYSDKAGTVLYAQDYRSEKSYWKNLALDKGSRTIRDPYGYIDGGFRPGQSYQYCCLSKNWQSTVTVLQLMPELQSGFGNSDLMEYVTRWERSGAWTQPDPCAPMVGVCQGGRNAGRQCTSANEDTVCGSVPGQCEYATSWSANYGVTYGPDGAGSCIKDTDPSDGIGRFPQLHGKNAGKGGHFDKFADTMRLEYVNDGKNVTLPSPDDNQAIGKESGLPGAPSWKKLEPD